MDNLDACARNTMQRRNRPKHKRAFVWCSILIVVIALYVWVKWATADIVTTGTIVDAVSPNGAWKASVDETTTEGLIATVTIASVNLVSTRDSSKSANILGVDTGGDKEQRPRIDWTGPHRLHIIVPSAAQFVHVRERHYKGVRVDVDFEPVDEALARQGHGIGSDPGNGGIDP